MSYTVLIDKLDHFTRKYYKNQILKGSIYSGTAVLVFYLSAVLLEYFGQFGTTTRTLLFYGFILCSLTILGVYIVDPLLKLYKLKKAITHEDAAKIIGNHFDEVQDKLVNVLQLGSSADANSELLLASIDQKSQQLSPVPFSTAVDLKENIKRLRFALIPIVLIGGIALYNSDIFTSGTERLLHHGTHFEPQAPFKFYIEEGALSALKNEDLELNVKVAGEWVPNEAYLELEEGRVKMKKTGKSTYAYTLKNLQKDVSFNFYANGYRSGDYEVEVIPVPTLGSFEVNLDYPSYTGKEDEALRNLGDLEVPAGTKITWSISTEDADEVEMQFGESEARKLQQSDENKFKFSKSAMTSEQYAMILSNGFIEQPDSIRYALQVRPDLHPSIDVETGKDSLAPKMLFFKGFVQDDYGLKRLSFNYSVISEDKETKSTEKLQITPGAQAQFFHSFDLNKVTLEPGDKVEYYFEVWDNDAVNGSKSARTATMVFAMPDRSELSEMTAEKNNKIKSSLSKSISKAQKVRRGLKDLQNKMLDKKHMTWEEKNMLQDLKKQHEELKKDIEKINNQAEQNFNEQKEFNPELDERIMDKQKQLEELFKELMSPELEELMKELDKLMDKLDKKKLQEAIENFDMKNEDLEKELDRSLELFKQMEYEQKFEDIKKQLDELGAKQEELSEKSKERKADKEQIGKEQDKLNEEFKEVQKQMDDLKKLNEDLQNQNDMGDMDADQKKIEQEMNQSKQELGDNKMKKASDMQKKASQSMKSLAQKMEAMQNAAGAQQQGEDLNNLRNLLENVIKLSFDQEANMNALKGISRKDPKYVGIAQDQRKLKDGTKIVKDSLFALSKRVPAISSTVNKEINAIDRDMEKVLRAMTERRTPIATSRQQHVMKSLNNLALLLDEAVQQMQKQMQKQNQGPSSKNCKKPGSKPGQSKGMKGMSKMQDQLNKQIEALKKALEKGQKPGQGKPGQMPGMMGKMSKELAQMAARQAALRQKLSELSKEKGNKKGGAGLDDLMKKMEETEKDIVNKNISNETLKRQQEIMVKLLEAEKAEREQDWDNKRESREAKNQKFSNPNQFFEYNSLKNKETEFLRTVPVNFKVFYRSKAADYFNSN